MTSQNWPCYETLRGSSMKSGNTPDPILDIKRSAQSSNNFPLQQPHPFAPVPRHCVRQLFNLFLWPWVSHVIKPVNVSESSWNKSRFPGKPNSSWPSQAVVTAVPPFAPLQGLVHLAVNGHQRLVGLLCYLGPINLPLHATPPAGKSMFVFFTERPEWEYRERDEMWKSFFTYMRFHLASAQCLFFLRGAVVLIKKRREQLLVQRLLRLAQLWRWERHEERKGGQEVTRNRETERSVKVS